MAPSSANVADFAPSAVVDNTERNLLSFYVLHKASSKLDKRSNGAMKPRRKIDLSPSKPKLTEQKLEVDESRFEHPRLRIEACQLVLSKMETTVKNVLKEINTNIFDEIYRWTSESFNLIRTIATDGFRGATRSFPLVAVANCRLLFTGLVLTKNMEFVDDLLTFEELGLHLKSHGCYVAQLSALDFLSKNGIGGCLRSLLRQFLMVSFDAPELSILASWYTEQVNYRSPMVVIIEDLERCCGTVLSELIIMLSEWTVKIPIILLMGVTTTLDAPRNILSSKALQLLSPNKFILGLPAERMDAAVAATLLRQCSMISVGHKVADFLRNYFLNQDGTLTSFIRGLKIACVQHFCSEPLSFMLAGLLDQDNDEDDNNVFSVDAGSLEYASKLKFHSRYQISEHSDKNVANGLLELKQLRSRWNAIVLCLYEAGKCNKLPLLDILCEALDKDLYKPINSENLTGSGKRFGSYSSSDCEKQHCFIMRKGGPVSQAVHRLRGVSRARLCQLLISWAKHTVNFPEVHGHLRELQSALEFDAKSAKKDLPDISKHAFQMQLCNQDTKSVNEKAVTFLNLMVREYLKPIECIPFHEVICFKEVEKLKLALIGDPRRRIQRDLLDFHKILKCSCCSAGISTLFSSMHDSSILYILSQEHGDLINLHDWFQSFKQTLLRTSTKKKQNLRNSSPKKRKVMDASENTNQASSIQARFCRAVSELQIAGLLRLPTKRRPDFVQRVAFGL